MFSVAVIRLKDILKFFMILFFVVLIIIFAKKYFNKKLFQNINIGQKVSNNIDKYIKKAIHAEIPEIEKLNNNYEAQTLDENIENDSENLSNKILDTMLSFGLNAINIKDENKQIAQNEENIVNESLTEESEKQKDNNEIKDEVKEEPIKPVETALKTEVVTKNPLSDSYNKNYQGVKIKNETSFDISDEILNPSNLKINKSNIIIFHTHTCESYTSSEKYSYTPTGKFRTTDLKYSVARVGDELTNYLKQYKINVVHDKTYHDYPSYNGSYSRSLSTVAKVLKTTKADIIIDLHRDAIGSNSSYAPTVKIGDDYCAQLMFVMGSNGGGLKHPNWKSNLQFAVKVQQLANKYYPGLFKPIILRNSRYNQHLGKAACIIEVGSTGNTLEQCLNSMKYLSKIINDL